MRVKRADLPRLFGITRQSVHADIHEGYYRPGPDGLFDVVEVIQGRRGRSTWHGGKRFAYTDSRYGHGDVDPDVEDFLHVDTVSTWADIDRLIAQARRILARYAREKAAKPDGRRRERLEH